MLDNTVTWKFAEVTNTYEDTYKYLEGKNVDNLFKIDVVTYGELEARKLSARPANSNIKQIPLVGEHVIIFNALQQESDNDIKNKQWYYLPAYNLQSSINNNALPGVADVAGQESTTDLSDQPLGKTFEEKAVSPLQPYEGDLLIEGRFSNSIRLGSTVNLDSNNYTENTSWIGNTFNDPIIILSNGHQDKPQKQFTIESIENDLSSLYLTSTQEVQELTLSSALSKTPNIGTYNNSQFIGTADRIILKAKRDVIILDSPSRITLNTDEVFIGGETKNMQPLVKGDDLKKILSDLIDAILKGVIYPPAGFQSIPDPSTTSKLINIRSRLKNINSSKHKIDQ